MQPKHREFWDRLNKVPTGLLGIKGRHFPMTHYPYEDENAVYFLTAQGTHAHNSALKNEDVHYLVSSDQEGLYADVNGKLSIEADQNKIDEIWNAVAASWFEHGRTDNSLRLLKLTPQAAEMWLATDSKASFLIEIVKSNLAGTPPDIGSHNVLSF